MRKEQSEQTSGANGTRVSAEVLTVGLPEQTSDAEVAISSMWNGMKGHLKTQELGRLHSLPQKRQQRELAFREERKSCVSSEHREKQRE